MQALQPTQMPGSMKTMPSAARFRMAPVGQAATHQGVSQWKHGMKMYSARGRPPTILGPTGMTWLILGPTGRDLLLLH